MWLVYIFITYDIGILYNYFYKYICIEYNMMKYIIIYIVYVYTLDFTIS